MKLTKLATVAATASMGLVLFAQANPATAAAASPSACYWMSNIPPHLWVASPSPVANQAACKRLDSCSPDGGKQSGGGCYHWATADEVKVENAKKTAPPPAAPAATAAADKAAAEKAAAAKAAATAAVDKAAAEKAATAKAEMAAAAAKAVAAPATVAAAAGAPATIFTCQQMSDTYGITHNKTWGTATAAIQDQWMKKGCTTIAQAKPAIAQTSVPKPNSQSEVAPMQTMSQEAAPMSRSAKPVTPSTVPPKPNSPPKVAPMQVMSQQAAPMSRSATQPVAPATVPPKKE